MSDEEKKAIEYLKQNSIPILRYDNFGNILSPLYYGTFEKEIILNLIEKQSKEIEELKDKNKFYNTAYNLGKTYSNKKWEDKIKAKIEEIKNTGIDVAWEQVNYTIREQDRAKIQVLQSLLEKE